MIIITITRSNLLKNINVLMAMCLVIWYVFPGFSDYTVIWALLASVWFFTALTNGYLRQISTKRNLIRFFLISVWFLLALLISFDKGFDSIYWSRIKLLLLGLFCVEVFRFYFEKKDFITLKKIALLTAFTFIVAMIRSFIFVGDNHTLIKHASAFGTNNNIIGNFGHYYSSVFILFSGLYLLFSKKNNLMSKIIGIILSVVSILAIIKAEFTIAYFTLLIIFISWFVFNKLKSNKIFWVPYFIILISIFVSFGIPKVIQFLNYFSNYIDSVYIKTRIQDIAFFLSGNEDNAINTVTRLNYYSGSISNFFSSFMLGTDPLSLFGVSLDLLPSGHNSLLYTFEAFGLFLAIFYFYFWITIYKDILYFWKKLNFKYYVIMLSIVWGYIFLSCINPTFILQTMSFVMMFLIPFAPLIGMNVNQIKNLLVNETGD